MIAAVALGSNLGDRKRHLTFGFERLGPLFRGMRTSSLYETAAVGMIGPAFLNAAAVGDTMLGARELLDALLAIETARGRERPFPVAPRTLDLDLILWGDLIANEANLIVPHPRFRDRRFVLEPLAEIAPTLVDPVTGRSVEELLTRLGDGSSAFPPK